MLVYVIELLKSSEYEKSAIKRRKKNRERKIQYRKNFKIFLRKYFLTIFFSVKKKTYFVRSGPYA